MKIFLNYSFDVFKEYFNNNRKGFNLFYKSIDLKDKKNKLLLQVEQRGAIWFVDKDGFRHSVTWNNLMPLFESIALGITNNDLYKISVGSLEGF